MSKKRNAGHPSGKTANGQRREAGRWQRRALMVLACVVVGFLFLLVREVRKPPAKAGGQSAKEKAETSPLTDVAPRQSRRPSESGGGKPEPAPPPPQQTETSAYQKVAEPAPYILPPDMPRPFNHPPATPVLADPGEPTPPDPFVEPEIAQDPDRGRRPEDQ
jgi:hypothetical protein